MQTNFYNFLQDIRQHNRNSFARSIADFEKKNRFIDNEKSIEFMRKLKCFVSISISEQFETHNQKVLRETFSKFEYVVVFYSWKHFEEENSTKKIIVSYLIESRRWYATLFLIKASNLLVTYLETNSKYSHYKSINYRSIKLTKQKINSDAVYEFDLQTLQFCRRLYLNENSEHASTKFSNKFSEESNTQ